MKDKTILDIDGAMERMDGKEIDIEKFNNELIEWVESKEMLFGGIITYHKPTADEDERNNNELYKKFMQFEEEASNSSLFCEFMEDVFEVFKWTLKENENATLKEAFLKLEKESEME